jgi:hypothetical protein
MRVHLLLLLLALSLSPSFAAGSSDPPKLGKRTWGEVFQPGADCKPVDGSPNYWQDAQGTTISTRAGRVNLLIAPGGVRFSDGVSIEHDLDAAACLARMQAHLIAVKDYPRQGIFGEGQCAAGRYRIMASIVKGKVSQITIIEIR